MTDAFDSGSIRHHTERGSCVTACGRGTHAVVYATEQIRYTNCTACLSALPRASLTRAQKRRAKEPTT